MSGNQRTARVEESDAVIEPPRWASPAGTVASHQSSGSSRMEKTGVANSTQLCLKPAEELFCLRGPNDPGEGPQAVGPAARSLGSLCGAPEGDGAQLFESLIYN